ncbi:hypothetical protein AAFN90_20160, partial [Erwiniaceae bacterium CAU 1747]
AERLSLHAQKDMTTLVKNDQSLTVEGGNRTLNILAGDETKTIKQGNQTIKVHKTFSLDAGEKLELICGKASITLTEDGTIKINGISINNLAETDYSVETKTLKANGSEEHVLTGKIIKLNP